MSDPTNNADYVIEALCKEFPELLVAVEGQAEYEVSMRRLFNENHSNKPRALVRPKTVDEVCHVLKFASANQLQVSVLGGGHDPKGIMGKCLKLRLGNSYIMVSSSEVETMQSKDLVHAELVRIWPYQRTMQIVDPTNKKKNQGAINLTAYH